MWGGCGSRGFGEALAEVEVHTGVSFGVGSSVFNGLAWFLVLGPGIWEELSLRGGQLRDFEKSFSFRAVLVSSPYSLVKYLLFLVGYEEKTAYNGVTHQ